MADEGMEVIYKGWLKKANAVETKKKSFLNRPSNTWKKRYLVLLRQQDEEDGEECPFLFVYDKEPATESERPKGLLKLAPHYRVDKKHDPTGKSYIFEVHTPEESFRLQSDSETNMDLWVFYLQIQTKLIRDFPGYCFEVMPDESDPMRRIGAKGSKCLLHVSKWGLTLALKRTRSLLAQWPLKSIRIFESSETGAFSFEAGRSAPMGEARYLFGTNPGEDGRMYDLLDSFTSQMQEQRNDGSTDPNQPATEEEVTKEYEKLRLATFGLLMQRTSSAPSAGTPTVSRAVPVPTPHGRGPTTGYDRLHRGQEGLARQQSDRLPGAMPTQTQGIPIRGNPVHLSAPLKSTGPPLPPRQEGLKHPPSSFQRSYSERGASLERYGRSLEGHEYPIHPGEEPYTSMTSSSALSRGGSCHRSFTEGDMLQMSRAGESFGNIMAPDKLRHMLSRNPSFGVSEYEAMALRLGHNPYQNSGASLLPNSYENTPLISPSPRDGVFPGFPNMGFVSSPHSMDSAPPAPPRKYHPPRRTSASADMRVDAEGKHQPIRHTYFQHHFNKPPVHAYMYPSLKGSARGRPLSDFRGYSSIKDSTLGSHQYQEVNMFVNQRGTLRRSMSVDHLFTIRSPSISSSISSALSIGSPLIGSLDLAMHYSKSARAPSWLGSRQLPSPPPLGTHAPEFNAYCGSPRGVVPPFADFSTFAATQAPYSEIKGNRNSFNNNNQRQPAGEIHTQALDASVSRNTVKTQGNQDLPMEEGYLEPTFKMKRSRSEADILDATAEELPYEEGTKPSPRARSKSKGFFATFRKKIDSNPDVSEDGAAPEQRTNQSAVASLMKRSQSNPDLLDDRPASPSGLYRQRSPNVATVKPASHSNAVAPIHRRRKFEFSLKIFHQNSKTADREEGGNESGGSEGDSKSDRRNSRSSLSDTKSSPQTQARSSDKNPKSPGVKGIVASEKTISFKKTRPQGTPQAQPPSPQVKPIVAAKPRETSPSVPMTIPAPVVQSVSPEGMPLTAPSEKAARERLREVANRPLPSPPCSSTELQREPSSKSNVRRFTPGMDRHPLVSDGPQGTPSTKTNRVKKTPPPPPPRDPQITLDSVSVKSSRTNSNASEYENTVKTRRLSSEVARSASFSDSTTKMSIDNVSLRSSRTNSTGSQYENTDFGSLPTEMGTPPASLEISRSLPARNSGVSLDGEKLGKSPSFLEPVRRISADNSSLRSSRTNSSGSQYENTELCSLPAENGTDLAQPHGSESLGATDSSTWI